MEDAAHSLRLALEREEAAHAHQEAAALRRSRELQRGFLSRLSHELRTPLTAIRGYASSLMQPDVTWDGDSQQRFLDRIAAESARLGRLVDDLLDFSAIESGIMRLQPDWCDLRLVIEAAIACLPPAQRRGGRADLRRLTCPRLGRPRPARAGLREPAEQRAPAQPAGHQGHGHRRPAMASAGGAACREVADQRRSTTARECRPSWRPRRSSPPGGGRHNGRGHGATVASGGATRKQRGRRARPVDRDGHRARLTAAGSSWTAPRRAPASGVVPARVRGRRSDGDAMTEGCGRKTRALLVEDDPNIVDLIRSNLAVRGFDTVVSRRRHARAPAARDRAPGHRAARPDAPRGRRLRAVPPDPRALAGRDHRRLGPRRRAGQGDRAATWAPTTT